MRKIWVGSTNPLKIEAIRKTFPEDCLVSGLDTFQSGVSEEPEGLEETLQGAKFRAQFSKKTKPDGHLWIGVESGFYQEEERWMFVNGQRMERWIVIVALYFIDATSEWTVWSEPLVCPITAEQRENSITEAALRWKKQNWIEQ